MVKSGWIWLMGGLLLLVTSCVVTSCGLLLKPPIVMSVHLTLGNPSNATTDVTNADNYLLLKPQYALSYNNLQHIPNWASWQLNGSWLGTATRRNDFRPDDSLPESWYRVVPGDYSGSGFDRGHMTPSADRTITPEANSATFLMTNILPQAPDNNQGPWAALEDYCRDLVRQGKELYIISGGYEQKRTIGPQRVTVPARTWKVIAVLDQPGQGVQGIRDRTRVIAVDMPNGQGIRDTDWRSFRVSVDAIETATGYDFLSNVPEAIQKVIERTIDQQ